MTTFELIDTILKQRGITPSHMMKELGFSSGLYSQWKKGGQTPSTEKMTKVSEYLNIPLDAILKPEMFLVSNGQIGVNPEYVLNSIEKKRLEEEHEESERIKKSIIETLNQMSADNLRKAEKIVKVMSD